MSRDKLQPPGREATYDVGYGKPPKATRFKAGQSGNPRGRPKGSHNKRPALHEERLKDIILDEAYRDIHVRDGDRMVTVPMAQAIIRALAVNAAKGQHRAQRLFAEILATTERQRRALHDDWLDTAITYKVEWDRELARRDRLGIEGPEPLPHPDHVKIDLNAGTARIVGPATREELAELQEWKERKATFEEELVWLEAEADSTDDDAVRQIIINDITKTKEVLAIIERALSQAQ